MDAIATYIIASYTTLAFLLILISTLCIIYLTFRPYYLLKRSGLSYPLPLYPIFGHQLSLMVKGFQICHSSWRDQLNSSKNNQNRSKEFYKIYAICDGLDYNVVISDPRILKYVLVRDFHAFPNRKLMILHQKCVAKSVIAQPYQEWKENRKILIGTFTTSMIKQMLVENVRCTVDLMENAGLMTEDRLNLPEMIDDESGTKVKNRYSKILAEKIIDSRQSKQQNTRYPLMIDGKTPFEAKTLFGNYAIDIITRNAFGLKLKFGTREHTQFVKNTHQIFTYQMYRFIMLSWFKPIASLISSLLKISFVGEPSLLYIRDVIRKFADVRLGSNLNRKDLYQIMVNAAKKNLQNETRRNNSIIDNFKGCPFGKVFSKNTDKNIVNYDMENVEANSIFIILATYDTLSTALSWIVYHLAQNPGMQDLIYQEIVEELKAASSEDKTNIDCSSVSSDDDSGILINDHNSRNLNGKDRNGNNLNSDFYKVDYDFLKRLKYTEMFVKEVLRHDPPLAIINRVANEDYTIPIKDNEIKISKGTLIDVPIYAIHHDPEYWADPDTFDPERFNSENSYNKFAYMPFGLGPRNCAAEKYAMLTLKTFLAVVLQKVEFKKCSKTLDGYTPYDTAFKKNEFHYPKCGIWLVAHPRI